MANTSNMSVRAMSALFAALGLSVGASSEEIRQAYRSLALRWHPDKHPDPDDRAVAAERFLTVREAYEALCKLDGAGGKAPVPPPPWQEDLLRQRRERERRHEEWQREREQRELKLAQEEAERRRVRAQKDNELEGRLSKIRYEGKQRRRDDGRFGPSLIPGRCSSRCEQQPNGRENEADDDHAQGEQTPHRARSRASPFLEEPRPPGERSDTPLGDEATSQEQQCRDQRESQRHEEDWQRRRREVLEAFEKRKYEEDTYWASQKRKAEESRRKRRQEEQFERQRREVLNEFERKRKDEEDEVRKRRTEEHSNQQSERSRFQGEREQDEELRRRRLAEAAASLSERKRSVEERAQARRTARASSCPAGADATDGPDATANAGEDDSTPRHATDGQNAEGVLSDNTPRFRSSATPDIPHATPRLPEAAPRQRPMSSGGFLDGEESFASRIRFGRTNAPTADELWHHDAQRQVKRREDERERRRQREDRERQRLEVEHEQRRERWDKDQIRFIRHLRQLNDIADEVPKKCPEGFELEKKLAAEFPRTAETSDS